jgi:hypothetical protein
MTRGDLKKDHETRVGSTEFSVFQEPLDHAVKALGILRASFLRFPVHPVI